MPPILEVETLGLSFGGLKAVSEFNLQLDRGELQGLIGPNGAGKTTVFNLLTGIYQPDHGSIRLDGRPITGCRPWRIACSGLARTFQNIRLCGNLTVLDNVRMACHLRVSHTLLGAVCRSKKYREEESESARQARALLDIFGLSGRAAELACNLPYGDQRRLEIARALATNPKVLLLDEPAAGMNPQETQTLRTLIRQIRDRFELSILLIEHDMSLVMDVCERITVLDYGAVIAHGRPQQVQNDPKVIEAYLGTPDTKFLKGSG